MHKYKCENSDKKSSASEIQTELIILHSCNQSLDPDQPIYFIIDSSADDFFG
jgi:hypothetical protein